MAKKDLNKSSPASFPRHSAEHLLFLIVLCVFKQDREYTNMRLHPSTLSRSRFCINVYMLIISLYFEIA